MTTMTRSERFRYRHSPAGAAEELSIPETWIWFWIWSGRISAKRWNGRAWVCLEHVRELLEDPDDRKNAMEATNASLEPILSELRMGGGLLRGFPLDSVA